MDQSRSSSRLHQGSDVCDSSDRKDERRAAVAQMMAENGEGLGMKVIAVMVQRYGMLPKEMWDLNSMSDMGAGRGLIYDEKVPRATLARIASNNRFSILNLTINKSDHKVDLPLSLRRLTIMAHRYNHPLDDLPENLQELIFVENCFYNQPLVLPSSLRKVVLGAYFSRPITLPPHLLEVEFGCQYLHPLSLPPSLKRLAFDPESRYNLPIAFPSSLVDIQFGRGYNQPTVLPAGIKEVRVGPGFYQDLSFPNSVRTIRWGCNKSVQIPEGVSEVEFSPHFKVPVILPSSVKRATFEGWVGLCENGYQRVTFPEGLEELTWSRLCDGLVLPDGLWKLTWGCRSKVRLPSSLRELTIHGHGPSFDLPEGLLRVDCCDCQVGYQYQLDLPESVQEMVWSDRIGFTHPTTLHHLIIHSDGWYVDLSHHSIHKVTIDSQKIQIKKLPPGLKELEFIFEDMAHPVPVPKGCEIVGEKRPTNVIMEE